MSSPFLGEIRPFGFNFNPRGWLACQGQILSIAQNPALFALLGTQYGGNGTTTFALPDLRGRVPMGQGAGPGLTNRLMGELGGEENHTLTTGEMPAHSHTLGVSSTLATNNSPAGGFPAQTRGPTYSSSTDSTISGNVTGGGLAHNNLQPYLVVNYCIAIQGIFPSRN